MVTKRLTKRIRTLASFSFPRIRKVRLPVGSFRLVAMPTPGKYTAKNMVPICARLSIYLPVFGVVLVWLCSNSQLLGRHSNPGTWSSVAPVPEPEQYALMLAGLGVIGFMVRRKRRQEISAAC